MILNEEQKRVVYTNEKHVFLLATAGSGKTRVIVERIKYLINSGVKPSSILAITFTKKAALEMKERINHNEVVVNTFHQYCYHLIKAQGQFKMISEVNHYFLEEETLKISLYKNTLYKVAKPKGYNQYQKFLSDNNAKDFDDLLLEGLEYGSNHDFKYIFIDEFQDTNYLQFELLKRMIRSDVSTLAVGDPDQSIYAFRGSNVKIIKLYLKTFQAKLLQLKINYRSSQAIINTANRLISFNRDRIKKELVANSNDSGVFKVYLTDKIDYQAIVTKICELKSVTNEIAVLYRFHYQGILLNKYLRDYYLLNVVLMTIHEAKGLEFDCVIIIGLEVMPVLISNQVRMVEEERRLLFVAVTRSKRYLYIYSTKKTLFYRQLVGQ